MKNKKMRKILTGCNVLFLGIAALLTSCDKLNKSNEKSDVTITNSSKEYFEGIIKFEETNVVESFSKISITLKDEGVQCEVVSKFNIDNENYGMLYKKGDDSVYYYFSKKEKSYYTLIPKKDFKNWVLSLEKPKSVIEGDFEDSFD